MFHKIPCFGSADDSSNQVSSILLFTHVIYWPIAEFVQVAADECVPAKITGGPGGVVVLESVPSINQVCTALAFSTMIAIGSSKNHSERGCRSNTASHFSWP